MLQLALMFVRLIFGELENLIEGTRVTRESKVKWPLKKLLLLKNEKIQKL